MHISLSCLLLFKRWVQHGDVHAGEAPLVMSTCPRRQKFIFLNNVVVISLSFFLTPYRIQKRSFFFWFLIFFFFRLACYFHFLSASFHLALFFFLKAESLKHFLLFLTIQFKKRGGGEMQTVFFFFLALFCSFFLALTPLQRRTRWTICQRIAVRLLSFSSTFFFFLYYFLHFTMFLFEKQVYVQLHGCTSVVQSFSSFTAWQ